MFFKSKFYLSWPCSYECLFHPKVTNGPVSAQGFRVTGITATNPIFVCTDSSNMDLRLVSLFVTVIRFIRGSFK